MQLTFKEAKANFFRPDAVTDPVEKESRKEQSKLAAYARTTAKRSIRKARKLKLSEMTPEMREKYGPKRDAATGRFASQGTKSSGGSATTKFLKSSDPGEPPRSRSGRLKVGILYAFDPSTLSAVAGATRFSAGHAPQVLEDGGQSQVTIVEMPKKRPGRQMTEKQREGLAKARAASKLRRRKGKASKVKKSVQIAARPYMAPALEVVKPMIPTKFKNLIKK